MIKELIDYLKNKKILILGFGKEGKSTYNLIRKYLKEQVLYIADKEEYLNDEALKNDKYIKCFCGNNYLDNVQDYDIIIKAPGISLMGKEIKTYMYKIKSQLELLLEFFDVCMIGITGTKGKSTTTSLIYEVLKNQGKKAILLGNIGVPIFDYIDKIENNSILVLELSSHQLEFVKLSPHISIFLNIFEEHLDHYGSFEKYFEAKCNIFKYQKENDYFLYNSDNKFLNENINNVKSKKYKVSLKSHNGADIYIKDNNIYFENKPIYNIHTRRNLVGDYNLNNIMFVLGISEILGLDMKKTIDTISNFETLEHRLELVGNFGGVFYYDNSIATVPIATIEAIEALENVDTLIIGGMDRGINYSDFIDYLNSSNIRNIVCMPKTGHDIAEKLKQNKRYVVNTLEEAVDIAKKVTEKGKSCLLSPAAASYGFFKNFEEKGNLYKKLVRGI